jgi:hypothetical protein
LIEPAAETPQIVSQTTEYVPEVVTVLVETPVIPPPQFKVPLQLEATNTALTSPQLIGLANVMVGVVGLTSALILNPDEFPLVPHTFVHLAV